MYDVFISYAREDLHRVEPIVKELLKLGWRVFVDRNILPGSNWRGDIDKALKETCCVLVVWTLASVNDQLHPWVYEEAECGRKQDTLVPLCLDGVQQPRGFCSVQSVDLSGWNGNSSDSVFVVCINGIMAKIKARFDRIMDLLNDAATIAEALILAEKLPFRGNDHFLFEQLRRDYNKNNSDSDLLDRIRQFLLYYNPENINNKESQAEQYRDDQIAPWHHLDKKTIKQKFRQLWLDKKSFVKVIFIEKNADSFSHYLHNILKTYYERDLLKKPIGAIKGGMSDSPVISDLKELKKDFAFYVENYFGISGVTEKMHEETFFIVQSIDNFSYKDFKSYYRLWVKLKPEKPLFLFFHIDPGALRGVEIDIPNYYLCRCEEHEKVNGNDFMTFISDSAKEGIFYEDTDICRCEPITFAEAVPKLESLKRKLYQN